MSELIRKDFSKGMLGTRDGRTVPEGYAAFIANADFTTGVPRPMKAPHPYHPGAATARQFFCFDDIWLFRRADAYPINEHGTFRDYCAETINGYTRIYQTDCFPVDAVDNSGSEILVGPTVMIFGPEGDVTASIGITPPSYPLQVSVNATSGIFNLKAEFKGGASGTLWTSNLTDKKLSYSVGLAKGSGASTLYGPRVAPVSVQISAPGIVILTWDPVETEADSLIVYGRTADKLWILAVLGTDCVTWTDDGTVTPTKPVVPANDPAPPIYTPGTSGGGDHRGPGSESDTCGNNSFNSDGDPVA